MVSECLRDYLTLYMHLTEGYLAGMPVIRVFSVMADIAPSIGPISSVQSILQCSRNTARTYRQEACSANVQDADGFHSLILA
jgi:hypothetical protein